MVLKAYFLRFFETSRAAPAAATKAIEPPIALPQPPSVPDDPEVFVELSVSEELVPSLVPSLAESPPDERT